MARRMRRKVSRKAMFPAFDHPDLTPQEHMRLAAEARKDSMEVGEFFRKLHEDIEHDRAALHLSWLFKLKLSTRKGEIP
jgi:hypothetical protein